MAVKLLLKVPLAREAPSPACSPASYPRELGEDKPSSILSLSLRQESQRGVPYYGRASQAASIVGTMACPRPVAPQGRFTILLEAMCPRIAQREFIAEQFLPRFPSETGLSLAGA